jgi:hypothetical protein
MPNARFAYLYRDASNYKRQGEVIFSNPDDLDVQEMEAQIVRALQDGRNFVASQVRVPEVFLWDAQADYDPDHPPAGVRPGGYVVNEDDHGWHEFDRLTETGAPATDEHGRTLVQFVEEIAQAVADGWKELAPQKASGKTAEGTAGALELMVPCTWECAGHVRVSISEAAPRAIAKAIRKIYDELPLPDGEYISDSLQIDWDGLELAQCNGLAVDWNAVRASVNGEE